MISDKVTIQLYLDTLFNKEERSFDVDLEPWIEEMFPTPTADFIPDWYKKTKVNTPDGRQTIKFCPSFINTFKNGFVLKNMADIKVSINNNQCEIVTTYPGEQTSHFQVHSSSDFGEHFPFDEDFFPASIKFQNPYMIRVPRDVQVVYMPCWWHEEYRNIRAAHGVITLPKGHDVRMNINSFLRIPKDGKNFVVPAQTPLVQMFFADIIDPKIVFNPKLSETKQAKRSMSYPLLQMTKYTKTPAMERVKNFLFKGKGK